MVGSLDWVSGIGCRVSDIEAALWYNANGRAPQRAQNERYGAGSGW
jgi:hypothetical protein